MKHLTTVLICAALATGAASLACADSNSSAVAQARYVGQPRISASHQPNGKPTKASSFAPRSSGGSHQHVYGAPIQSPIFHSQPKKKKPAATPAPK
jgi:hypothetical protein